MIRPRNTLVLVRLIEKDEQKVGKLVLPTNNDLYCEAEVLAKGPGTCSSAGAVSETADLQVGQRVWVKHKEYRGDPRTVAPSLSGIKINDGTGFVYIFEQTSIVGIIADQVTPRVFTGTDKAGELKVSDPDVDLPAGSVGRDRH